jgi:hypothetical protein
MVSLVGWTLVCDRLALSLPFERAELSLSLSLELLSLEVLPLLLLSLVLSSGTPAERRDVRGAATTGCGVLVGAMAGFGVGALVLVGFGVGALVLVGFGVGALVLVGFGVDALEVVGCFGAASLAGGPATKLGAMPTRSAMAKGAARRRAAR